jgi:amidohydrolase
MKTISLCVGALTALVASTAVAAAKPIASPAEIDALLPQVVAWRRDIHQHPELGAQEFRTAALIEKELRALGLEPRSGIAVTGVSAVLRGAKPGPKIALRADMDALPVTEATNLPFASKVTSTYRGQPVGVMHACGHDAHVAILLGLARLLKAHQQELAGEVMFIFQPAEEGPPTVGEPFGAKRMVDEGLFAEFKPDAIYGLHVWAALPVGKLGFRSGPTMAAADEWTLVVRGRQSHGSRPWDGVDPITVAAQIQLAMQSVIARQVDIVRSPVVLTTGAFQGGVRYNIIPERVDLTGTLRTFDADVRADVLAKVKRAAEGIAAASGATAEFNVSVTAPLTANDAELTKRSGAVLKERFGTQVIEMPLLTIAEDFSQFAPVAPTFYFFVGATALNVDPRRAPSNHSPEFMLDEGVLKVGLEALSALAFEWLQKP